MTSRIAAAFTLAQFVVWQLRHRDLPPDVQEAAIALSDVLPRPADRGLVDGSLDVYGFPADEEEPCVDEHDVFPHRLPELVTGLLDRGCQYVLVQPKGLAQ